MKTSRFHLLAIALFLGASITSCNKDNNSPSTGTQSATSSQVATAQDAESQDAIATKVEQDADNQADALEASDFNLSETKGMVINGVNVDVDHPDTTYFPKVITLTFNYADTVNGEHMSQTGTIKITVDTVPVGRRLWWRKHVMRTFDFTNFTVTTDSSSFTINGTRTMERKEWIPTVSSNKLALRVYVKDTIYSDLTIGITSGSYEGSFTRKVARTREEMIHYYKLMATRLLWHPSVLNDTLRLEGSITGVNLQDSAYSRVITQPLVYTFCPVWPHNMIATGQITDTEGTKVIVINYTADGCSTSISAKANGKDVNIHRKQNRRFRKWW